MSQNIKLTPSASKPKRGAPRGNQNARKHGLYSRVISRKDKHELEQAAHITGVDEEIALVRFRLQSILEKDPDNNELILQGVHILTRLIRTKGLLGVLEQIDWHNAIRNVLDDSATSPGFYTVKTDNRESQKS